LLTITLLLHLQSKRPFLPTPTLCLALPRTEESRSSSLAS
jgi:hypothetical protein